MTYCGKKAQRWIKNDPKIESNKCKEKMPKEQKFEQNLGKIS